MTKNSPIFSLYGSAPSAAALSPSFCYRLPDGKLEFDLDIKVLKQFFNNECCSNWINSLEVANYFKTSKAFLSAMDEAYDACKKKNYSVYFGTFSLDSSKPECRKVLFTSKLIDVKLHCNLLGFSKDVIASNAYKESFRMANNTVDFLSLTEREKEVLARIADGFTTKEIAGALFLSIHTVDSHKQKLYKKLEVRNTAELGKLAERYGLTRDARYKI